MKDLENFFYNLYKKVPWHLPTSVKEFIVKVGPWITLVIIILAAPVILLALGLKTFFAPFAIMFGGMHAGFAFLISGIIGLVDLIIAALALPGLFKRSIKSWQLVYYAALLGAVGQLLRFDIFGMIIGLALSLYVLFEIKSYYH